MTQSLAKPIPARLSKRRDRWTRLTAVFAIAFGVGCGIDESQFTHDTCMDDYDVIEAMVLDEPVDYLALRSFDDVYQESTDSEPSTPFVLNDVGAPCAGASDAAACMDALANLPVETEFVRHMGGNLPLPLTLVYSRGDEVGAVRTAPELLELLGGTIDSPEEAAFYGFFIFENQTPLAGSDNVQDHSLRCESSDEVGVHEEGFVLFSMSGGGCDALHHHSVLIRNDGSTTTLQSSLIQRAPRDCQY